VKADPPVFDSVIVAFFVTLGLALFRKPLGRGNQRRVALQPHRDSLFERPLQVKLFVEIFQRPDRLLGFLSFFEDVVVNLISQLRIGG